MIDTLAMDLEEYNANHEGNSQGSLASSDSEEDADSYEAPGFGAANRAFKWMDRYETPAVGGGKKKAGRKKQKEPRKELDTDDDQVFNRRYDSPRLMNK